MTIELLNGDAAVEAASDAEFTGTVNPRFYKVSPRLAEAASSILGSAFGNQWGGDVRLANAFRGIGIDEAFSTSDFKLAAFAELDTEMQGQYAELPSTWDQYTDTTTVRDFRPKRLKRRGSNTRGMARVPELTEYPADDDRYAREYAIQVAKYGRRKALSWEAWLNNEAVDELQDMPAELAREARETEQISAASNLLLVDPATNSASDVNTAFFKTGNGNAPTALPLTRDNLKLVLDGMAVKVDPDSKRTVARPEMVVVVPKALESQVLSIISAREVRREVTNQDGSKTITTENNEFAALSYVVDPMLDFMNTNSKAKTTWFVVPKPGGPVPALWVAGLAGHEQPDLRVKADGGQRVGGGDVSPLEGSFEIDDIQYRCRHIRGNQTGAPLFAYASRGA